MILEDQLGTANELIEAREKSREAELNDILAGQIEAFAPRVGVARAATAFGLNARTWRHRRQ